MLLFILFIMAGSSYSFAQSTRIADVVVKAPGLNISKSLEMIQEKTNSVHGVTLVAAYKQSDMLHLRIDRDEHPDNSVIYELFPDLSFSLIEDKDQVQAIINEATLPKSEIVKPVNSKNE